MRTTTGKSKQRVCVVNIGLYRSGSTTLVEASKELGMKAYRAFPDFEELDPEEMKCLLLNPEDQVNRWFTSGGQEKIIELVLKNDIICDGWIALLPFLETGLLQGLVERANAQGVHLEFVATCRSIKGAVESELHHWVIHNLERTSGLSFEERNSLPLLLRERAQMHLSLIQRLSDLNAVRQLMLQGDITETWSRSLSLMGIFAQDKWQEAFSQVGVCNANPPLPIEGILLTIRLGTGHAAEKTIESTEKLLDQIEMDTICRYLLGRSWN